MSLDNGDCHVAHVLIFHHFGLFNKEVHVFLEWQYHMTMIACEKTRRKT